MDYIVANHRFTIRGKTPQIFQKYLTCGHPFQTINNSNTEKKFTVVLDSHLEDWNHKFDLFSQRKKISVFEYENSVCEIFQYKNEYLIRLEFKDKKDALLIVSENNNTVFLTNFSSQEQTEIYDFQFLLWLIYGIATLNENTVAIHASTIVYQNQAILFLGESGTGKSTHTHLWQKHIKGSFVLNDDSPIVRIINGKPMAFGSMWSGKSAYYINESYPIAGMVRIVQAKQNTIKKLNKLEALAAVYPSCPPMFAHDKRLSENISEILSSILIETPIFTLYCLPDLDSVSVSFSAIFENLKR